MALTERSMGPSKSHPQGHLSENEHLNASNVDRDVFFLFSFSGADKDVSSRRFLSSHLVKTFIVSQLLL